MSEIQAELSPLEERPLVTFALFAYNQEKYIREAVKGAFEQTYQPLEIIISDDCSTDETFDIIRRMITEYDGPHKVRATRNNKNIGIAPHIQKIDQEANGALIIHAAGDDISLPERTSHLMEKWLYFYNKPSVIVSNAYIINKEGIGNETIVHPKHENCYIDGKENKFYFVLGCSLAVTKNLINRFDDIDPRIIAEDAVLYRRAELLNGIFYIKEPLVKWRHHSDSITQSGTGERKKYLDWEEKWTTDTDLRIKQETKDRKKLNITGSNYTEKYRNFINLKICALKSNPLLTFIRITSSLIQKKIDILSAKEIIKILLIRLRILNP